jgi:hypothetical protein
MGRGGLSGVWAILGLAAIGILPPQGKAERRLDPAIGPPVPERYQSVRDAQDWLNPYLQVCPQDVTLSVRSIKRVREKLKFDALRASLLDLPASAWPYGRIVGVQECSIDNPGGDAEARKKRRRDVESVLKALGVDISWWPG